MFTGKHSKYLISPTGWQGRGAERLEGVYEQGQSDHSFDSFTEEGGGRGIIHLSTLEAKSDLLSIQPPLVVLTVLGATLERLLRDHRTQKFHL